jgi:hypothetical protein
MISKLVYFFKSLPTEMTNAVIDKYNKRELDGMMRSRFNKIFPQYLLKDKIPGLVVENNIAPDCDAIDS